MSFTTISVIGLGYIGLAVKSTSLNLIWVLW